MSLYDYLIRPLFLIRSLGSIFYKKNNIAGTWDYECIVAEGEEFPYQRGGGNAHGGVCTIVVKNKLFTTELQVFGKRTWQGQIDEQNSQIIPLRTIVNLKQPMEWDSVKGAFISKKEIMYQYCIRYEPVYGITFLDLKYSKDEGKLSPIGKFYYFPDPQSVPIVPMVKLTANKKRARFGKIYGVIKLTNQRKA